MGGSVACPVTWVWHYRCDDCFSEDGCRFFFLCCSQLFYMLPKGLSVCSVIAGCSFQRNVGGRLCAVRQSQVSLAESPLVSVAQWNYRAVPQPVFYQDPKYIMHKIMLSVLCSYVIILSCFFADHLALPLVPRNTHISCVTMVVIVVVTQLPATQYPPPNNDRLSLVTRGHQEDHLG